MSVVNVVYPDGKRVPLLDLCVSPELLGDVNPNVSLQLNEETDHPMDVTVPERVAADPRILDEDKFIDSYGCSSTLY